MTEFIQPTTHVRAGWAWVHRTYRTQCNRRRALTEQFCHPLCRQRDKQEAFSEMFIARLMNICEIFVSEGQACFKTGRRPPRNK